MAKYNRITKRDIEIINNNLRSKPARERYINVLNYLKFHIEKIMESYVRALQRCIKLIKSLI